MVHRSTYFHRFLFLLLHFHLHLQRTADSWVLDVSSCLKSPFQFLECLSVTVLSVSHYNSFECVSLYQLFTQCLCVVLRLRTYKKTMIKTWSVAPAQFSRYNHHKVVIMLKDKTYKILVKLLKTPMCSAEIAKYILLSLPSIL